MEFLSIASSDKGIVKKTNQDSILIREGIINSTSKVLLAVLCDGMGGLEKGEIASATVVKAFSAWFEEVFPTLYQNGLTPPALSESWTKLMEDNNNNISNYGRRNGIQLGTTVVALLLANDMAYYMNVGDSRLYSLTDKVKQMSHDQSVVQMEIDKGILTEEQALIDPRRSVLLQCIGSSEAVFPDFGFDDCLPGTVYILCSDGLIHVVNNDEIYKQFAPSAMVSETVMKDKANEFIELVKNRKEEDNISAILIKTA